MSMTESVPEGHLQIAYEDVFPQPTETVEPTMNRQFQLGDGVLCQGKEYYFKSYFSSGNDNCFLTSSLEDYQPVIAACEDLTLVTPKPHTSSVDFSAIEEKYLASATTSASVSTEEQPMDNIEIKINGETIKTATKTNKPKSDYKCKPSVVALYHTADGAEIELKRFTGKSAASDAQAHLVTMIAKHPNAKMTPYTVGKPSKIKHQFTTVK